MKILWLGIAQFRMIEGEENGSLHTYCKNPTTIDFPVSIHIFILHRFHFIVSSSTRFTSQSLQPILPWPATISFASWPVVNNCVGRRVLLLLYMWLPVLSFSFILSTIWYILWPFSSLYSLSWDGLSIYNTLQLLRISFQRPVFLKVSLLRRVQFHIRTLKLGQPWWYIKLQLSLSVRLILYHFFIIPQV